MVAQQQKSRNHLPDPKARGPFADSDLPNSGWQAWEDALLSIPLAREMARGARLSGFRIKAGSAQVLEAWLEEMRTAFYPLPFLSLPASLSIHDLTGSLDLTRTLASGEAIWQTGLLERATNGYLVLDGGERIEAQALHHVLDHVSQGKIGLVVIDRTVGDEEALSSRLVDQLDFHLDFSTISQADLSRIQDFAQIWPDNDPNFVELANATPLNQSHALQQLCEISLGLGLTSMRPPTQAMTIATAHARLLGRWQIEPEDIASALRLSLLHRAQAFPFEAESSEPEEQTQEQTQPEAQDDPSADDPNHEANRADVPPQDVEVDIEDVKLPGGLVAHVLAGLARQKQLEGKGRGRKAGSERGRPLPSRKGKPGRDGRIDLYATLKAAVPWQNARRKQNSDDDRVRVHPSDIHVKRYRQAVENVTIFAVDASGSTALNRLGEAKGAVEFLLAESYVTRDQVALVSFRRNGAELLVPPTRSLARAKRCLANLQGGGGTPLADGLRLSLQVTEEQLRQGRNVSLVVLTDGSANIALDGKQDRASAMEDAQAVATQFRALPVSVIVLDVGRGKNGRTNTLAESLGARLVAMPFSSARNIVSELKRTA